MLLLIGKGGEARMTPEERYERRHNRVHRKWVKLRKKAAPCCDCHSANVGLNDSYSHRFRRFFLECENCHWCAGSFPTIRLAVWDWNRQKSTEEQIYGKGGADA